MAAGPRKPPYRRRLLAALAVSVLAHLLASGGIDWPSPDEVSVSPPIEARLAGPATEPPKPPPRPAPRAASRPAPPVLPAPPAPPAPEPDEAPAPVVRSAPESPAEPSEPAPAVEAAAEPLDPLAALPERFSIRYRVQGNEGGFVLGQLTHRWRRSGERYSLVGVAEASGVVALFYSGLLSQTSDGTLTPEGLRPENYWMQRGRRRFSAQFDWQRGIAKLGDPYGAVAIRAGTQDYLSVVYQLALFPRAASGVLAVVNGKRFKEYRYEALGTEVLELPAGAVEALHVRVGQGGEADDIELWLRAAPPHLPVKIALTDNKGKRGVLLAEAIGD